jgi:hypothetical protein
MADKTTTALVTFAEIIGLPLRYRGPEGCRRRRLARLARLRERRDRPRRRAAKQRYEIAALHFATT